MPTCMIIIVVHNLNFRIMDMWLIQLVTSACMFNIKFLGGPILKIIRQHNPHLFPHSYLNRLLGVINPPPCGYCNRSSFID